MKEGCLVSELLCSPPTRPSLREIGGRNRGQLEMPFHTDVTEFATCVINMDSSVVRYRFPRST